MAMDNKEYLSSLKTLNYPKTKATIKEKEEILLEDEYQSRGMSDIHAQIIEWFLKNPYPKDDAVHTYAEKLGIDPEEFENHIFMILSSFLSEGYSKGKDIKHDPDELKMGIEVEYEHTTNPLLSRKISLDHLTETPDYYTRLKRMEEEADDYWSSRNDERSQR